MSSIDSAKVMLPSPAFRLVAKSCNILQGVRVISRKKPFVIGDRGYAI